MILQATSQIPIKPIETDLVTTSLRPRLVVLLLDALASLSLFLFYFLIRRVHQVVVIVNKYDTLLAHNILLHVFFASLNHLLQPL